MAEVVRSIEELQQRLQVVDCEPRTSDDVSVTSDGVRLDSKDKVLAFLEQLDRERAW